jgi:alpha-mannosidase
LKLTNIKEKATGYWAERIISQLEYAIKLSHVSGNDFNGSIDKTVEFLTEKFAKEGAITKQTATEAENMISSLSEEAKKYKVICAAHAHIDMNWMWSYAETVAITLETFRTMLNLMNEYPEFTFSQSQASVYRIVEKHDPKMLEEIKQRVKEGRWEVTASTWVETDKNMPNGESLARHILYTKKYLSELLDISPDSLKLDFEPDTFGHNINVPEITSQGGVKYYYHCRGYDKHIAYRWQSPSGSSILVYREPFWYNARIEPEMGINAPEVCAEIGTNTMLKVYGVGDHGGGPTRKDIEKIIDMSKWSVFPEIKFGTFIEFYEELEKVQDRLPVEKNELNFIFTGCYTSQSRIKMSNRIGEAKLNEAEAYTSLAAAFAGGSYCNKTFADEWEKILFNHFHDIIPGSGVIDTREHAMGKFQEVLATANTETVNAFRNITANVNTAGLLAFEEDAEDISESRSEGAGVGFGIKDFAVPQTERGKGKGRIMHFFNPSPAERNEVVEVIIWDWPGDRSRIQVKDARGSDVKFQLIQNENKQRPETYWGHTYMRMLVDVTVPGYGYTTYCLTEKEESYQKFVQHPGPRVNKYTDYILENDYIKASFDTSKAAITSFVDKRTGSDIVCSCKPAGIFRLIEEDDSRGMTSWIVGRYMKVINLNETENVKITSTHIDRNALKQWISYTIEFGASKLNVTVSLDKNSTKLNYKVECDWQEKPVRGKYVPQLNFYMPLNYKCKAYKYDIPFGTIERPEMDDDVPANSWMAGIPEQGDNMVMLVTDTKYGFRGYEDSLTVDLLRSSYDPDPYPEIGIHKFGFALDVISEHEVEKTDDNNPDNKETINRRLIQSAYDYNHPVRYISGTVHAGSEPLEKSFMSVVSGNIALSAVKMPESRTKDENKEIIIRAYETEGTGTQAVIKFAENIKNAYFVDINENVDNSRPVKVNGNELIFNVAPYKMASVLVVF